MGTHEQIWRISNSIEISWYFLKIILAHFTEKSKTGITESRAAFREAKTLRDCSIKSTRCNLENYGRGSDWESNDGRALLLFQALSRGAWTVAGGNLCSVTLRQGGSIVWAKVSINRSSRRENKSVRVCEWASIRACVSERERGTRGGGSRLWEWDSY